MMGAIARHRSVIITFVLATLGFVLIGLGHTFHFDWAKIQLDRLVAEVGALLLVVGILHWLFDLGLRKEMLREVSATVFGSTLLHDSGVASCSLDSRQVDDREHWSRSANLTIGIQYSPKFVKDFHDVLLTRCERGLRTTVTVLRPEGVAARYLRESGTGNPAVSECVSEIASVLRQVDTGKEKHTRLVCHDRVLRYSFIQTDEFVWVKFFTNSPERATVPALKVRAGTPLFEFFSDDIQRLLRHSS